MATKIKTWTTKEGIDLNINEMATSHLLATIHMIERNRMNNLLSLGMMDNLTQDTVDYYAQFPSSYKDLCDEAELRFLIHRGNQKEGLIKRNKK